MVAWWAEELAIKVLDELNITNKPEDLLSTHATLLAEEFSKATLRDFAVTHGINTALGVVDDHTQPRAALMDTPLLVLASRRLRDVDIFLSSTTGEADWYAIKQTDKFDPGSIESMVDKLIIQPHIPRSRARKIVAAQVPTTSIDALQSRSAGYFHRPLLHTWSYAHSTRAFCHRRKRLSTLVGPVKDAPAVHGTEMYGIAGQQLLGCSDEQAKRNAFVREPLFEFAAGIHDRLWKKADGEPITYRIGDAPYDPTAHAADVLRTFKDSARARDAIRCEAEDF